MKKSFRFRAAFAALVTLATVTVAADLPQWAFPVAPPNPPRPPATPGTTPPVAPVPRAPNNTAVRVPDSAIILTREQLRARGPEVPDWHPDEHPPMPDIVRKGREPLVWACAYCHLPNGAGRPENSSLAGLSANYIKQQVLAFKNGERPGSHPNRGPQNNMINFVAKEVTEPEIEAAARYFAALKPQAFLKIIETDTVPKTIVVGAILAKVPAGGTEPIGNRIIEVPDELERFENRDSRTSYTVYVPPGSIKRGEELARTGGGISAFACAVCHGPGLKGLGDFPPLAGRSPSYLMRQLFDVKHEKRSGPTTLLMKQVVANLSTDDMLALTAYIASLQP